MMRIYSFVRDGLELTPVEVEVSLIPGLPQFSIMGLPDQAIKESVSRVRAALKASGYELPTRLKVLYNLRPASIRKKSEGIDFALAIAYLLKTEQISIELEPGQSLFVYGELGLNGEVIVSDEIELLPTLPEGAVLLTGEGRKIPVSAVQVKELKCIDQPFSMENPPSGRTLLRPPVEDLYFDQRTADLIAVIATGEHSVLLAGPAGSGKSTLAYATFQALRELTPEEQSEVYRIAKVCGQEPKWRPLVAPHHTIPVMSMVGGGAPPFPGEITRAHRGVLLLDEFLEFSNAAREALREPVESRMITVARKGIAQKFPADFLLFATSNLCPCGEYVPGESRACPYPIARCRAYLEKLSGPVLDRFEILALSQYWTNAREVSLAEIRERVQRAQEFARETRGQTRVNSRLTDEEIERDIPPFLLREVYSDARASRRRHRALARVARTVADLAGSQKVLNEHLDQARELTWTNFASLRRPYM